MDIRPANKPISCTVRAPPEYERDSAPRDNPYAITLFEALRAETEEALRGPERSEAYGVRVMHIVGCGAVFQGGKVAWIFSAFSNRLDDFFGRRYDAAI